MLSPLASFLDFFPVLFYFSPDDLICPESFPSRTHVGAGRTVRPLGSSFHPPFLGLSIFSPRSVIPRTCAIFILVVRIAVFLSSTYCCCFVPLPPPEGFVPAGIHRVDACFSRRASFDSFSFLFSSSIRNDLDPPFPRLHQLPHGVRVSLSILSEKLFPLVFLLGPLPHVFPPIFPIFSNEAI